MTADTPSANRQIAHAAGLVMAAFIVSNLVGLLRQILVAGAFGTQPEMDAFNAANRVSETIFSLVAGGALASAFIPVFTGLITHKKIKAAWQTASALANLVLLVLIVAAIAAAIFAPWIVRYVLAPGFAGHPIQEELTAKLLRIMLPSVAIFGMSGLVMGILNSYQVFFIPALAPAMYQLGLIFGVVVLRPHLGIFGLAWGVVIGSAIHLGLQIPSLVRLNGRYFATFGLDNPRVHEVMRLMIPRLLGVAVVQLNFWVNTRIASQQPEGSVTGIVFAFALMLMPQAAIAQSIAIAAMPTFSAQVALGKLHDMRASLAASLRGVLLLSIPASLGLMILRVPLVTTLYQRGAFDDRSTQLVAWALLWFAAGLVSHGLVEILSRAFYSLHDTKTPVIIGAVAMSLNVVFSYTFSAFFNRIGWMPHGGLALANTAATTLEVIGLLVLMRRKLNGLEGKWIIKAALIGMLGGILMSISLWLWLGLAGTGPTWVVALAGVFIGALVYGLFIIILGVPEAKEVYQQLKNRLI